ncbi:MAG: hypothetical protein CMN32_04950 [Saprospirales bacterium]|nr:hypothetical protein [Saprospirales bacterium]
MQSKPFQRGSPSEPGNISPPHSILIIINAMRFFLNLIFTIMLTNTAFSQSAFSADEQAIHQIVQDLQDGWNAKSGEQWAAHFADDHSYVVWTGLYMPHMNREQNAQAHDGLYNSVYKDMDTQFKVTQVRFIEPHVAMVHCLANSRYGDQPFPDYPELLQTMLMVKNGDAWEIVSFHNLDIEYDKLLRKPEPAPEEKLAYAKENYPGWFH